MYGSATTRYFDQLPDLPRLSSVEARRLLSLAYADVIARRDDIRRVADGQGGDVYEFLMRLAATLELHGVFRPESSAELRRSSAFISAECLLLAKELLAVVAPPVLPEHAELHGGFWGRETALSLEIGLLFLTAGFDANARLVASAVKRPNIAHASSLLEHDAGLALESVLALLRLDFLAIPDAVEDQFPGEEGGTLADAARSRIYRAIVKALAVYRDWALLRSDNPPELELQELDALAGAITRSRVHAHGDLVQTLLMLQVVVRALDSRLLRQVPVPAGVHQSRYRSYLRGRAQERPAIWPSAATFVFDCLPGPHKHAVVSLPTGAGKSFIAELAVSQAALTGWVLYLVPTNALAGQVRRDLSAGLRGLSGVQVRGFWGGGEYAAADIEALREATSGSVFVMTPEKAALALRSAPDMFAALNLLVFDECHHIGERGERGALAELVLAHVLSQAPNVKALFMSALLQNHESMAKWLEQATDIRALPIKETWRPTRTMRGVVGFDNQSTTTQRDSAFQRLRSKPRQKTTTFRASAAALLNLQGAWTDASTRNHAVFEFGIQGQLTLQRPFEGAPLGRCTTRHNKNELLAELAIKFSDRGESVLGFVLRDKNHVFSVANKISARKKASELRSLSRGELIDAYLVLAELELGCVTQLRDLLRHRVATHSRALLSAERRASEIAFEAQAASVMIATTTLAQGLNFPATVVILGGADMSDPREPPSEEGQARNRAQLLNAVGRAGRALVASHGLALVIPEKTVLIGRTESIKDAAENADFLRHEDASFEVKSRIGGLFSGTIEERMLAGGLSVEEKAAVAYLPFRQADTMDIERILRATFAAYSLGGGNASAQQAAMAVEAGSKKVLHDLQLPDWVAEASYVCGLPVSMVAQICRGAEAEFKRQSVAAVAPLSSLEWLSFLVESLRHCDLDARMALFGGKEAEDEDDDDEKSVKAVYTFEAIWRAQPPGEVELMNAWGALLKTMSAYLSGESYARIARLALVDAGDEKQVDPRRNTGSFPVPRVIKIVDRLSERLSRTAGALCALVVEGGKAGLESWSTVAGQSLAALKLLSLAIRHGCGSADSLAWFRHGVPYRAAAHYLGKHLALPPGLEGDKSQRAWIGEAIRGSWLAIGNLEDTDDSEIEVRITSALARVWRNEKGGDA